MEASGGGGDGRVVGGDCHLRLTTAGVVIPISILMYTFEGRYATDAFKIETEKF